MLRLIVNNYNKEKSRIRKLREKAMKEAALIVEADAKTLCPVRTGNLRRSITHAVKADDDRVTAQVGSNVEYAFFASLHTPYLEPALDQNIEAIKRKITDVMKQ